jgi:hypothetical protein
MAPFMDGLYGLFSPKGAIFIQVAEPWQTRLASHGYQNVTVEQFLSVTKSNITTLLDTPTWMVGDMYSWSSLPTLYVIYRNFTIAGTYTGENGITTMENNVAAEIPVAIATPVSEFNDASVLVAVCFATAIYVLRHRRT